MTFRNTEWYSLTSNPLPSTVDLMKHSRHLMVGLPAFNEEATIREVISSIPVSIEPFSIIEIVVVDDGSTDQTAAFAESVGATILRHSDNRGVGAAFRTLYSHALEVEADVLVTIDSDGQFPASEIHLITSPIVSGEALVVTASRFADSSLIPEMPWIKIWGNRQVAKMVSLLTGRSYADVSCGFRAYSREALCRLTVFHSFTYTHETFLDLATKGISILEVPVSIRGTREHGESKIASSVVRYGIRTTLIMLRTFRDHRPWVLLTLLGIPFLLMAIGFGALSLQLFLSTGVWLKWAALTSAALVGLTLGLGFLGFLADMLTRIRLNQEELIYWARRGKK